MASLLKFSGSFSDEFPSNEAIEAADSARERTWPL
jgi:hypothetical protein